LHYYGKVVALKECTVDIDANLLGRHYNNVALQKQQMNHGTEKYSSSHVECESFE